MLNIEQITAKSKKMKKTFLALTVAFIFFNFFLSLTLNLFTLSKREENRYFIRVELKSNVSRDIRKQMEGAFLAMPEINKVSFYGKDKAFIDLQKDLDLSLPKGENPLPDTFFLYFKDMKELEKIQEKIEKEEGVKEFFIDYSYLQSVEKRTDLYRGITLATFALFTVPCSLLIYFIFQTGCGFEILKRSLEQGEKRFLEKGAKIYNIILSVGASLLGTLIFLNLYFYIRKEMLTLDPTLPVMSLFEILYYQLGAVVACNTAIWASPGRLISKRSVEE